VSTSRDARETQSARTALAWQRTGLGLLLVAGLLVRAAAVQGDLVLVLPAGVVAVAGLVVLGVLTPLRRRASHEAAAAGAGGQAPLAATAVTALVVLAALCGLAAEFLR
jgi:putative membrane protein